MKFSFRGKVEIEFLNSSVELIKCRTAVCLARQGNEFSLTRSKVILRVRLWDKHEARMAVALVAKILRARTPEVIGRLYQPPQFLHLYPHARTNASLFLLAATLPTIHSPSPMRVFSLWFARSPARPFFRFPDETSFSPRQAPTEISETLTVLYT